MPNLATFYRDMYTCMVCNLDRCCSFSRSSYPARQKPCTEADLDELNRALVGDNTAEFLERRVIIDGQTPMAPFIADMGDAWAAKMSQWLPGAAVDLKEKLCSEYRRIDAVRFESDMEELMDSLGDIDEGKIRSNLDIASYVQDGARREVTIGAMGSVWMDVPLTGYVQGSPVTKMTRCSFVLIEGDRWTVHMDPTCDHETDFDTPLAAEYIEAMTYEKRFRSLLGA